MQLALAASVLALTTLGGLSTTYYLQQRAERRSAAGGRQTSESIDQVDHAPRAGPRAAPRTSSAGKSRWPPSSKPIPPAIRTPRPGSLALQERDPGRARRGPARQGAARSPGRHPLGRGRRPGRLDHRRRLRRRLPRSRDRPGQPAAGRGGGEDQGPPAVGGAGAGQRHSMTGRRSAAGSAGRRRRRSN